MTTHIPLKPPVSYYGGKQLMAKHILPLIPEHVLYCEAFLGGGAIFWQKDISKIEVINDLNGEVVNFYQVCKLRCDALDKLIKSTLHSRQMYQDAMVIYNNPHLFTELQRAWAFWVACNQSFSSSIGGGWGYDRKDKNKTSITVYNKKERFGEGYAQRLEKVSIEQRDALKVIESRDSLQTFFYLDPPYHNANQGHYAGYKESDFKALLETISKIKGRFLLSSYPSELLQGYKNSLGWHQKVIKGTVSVVHHKKTKKEVLTANYPI